MSVGMSWVVFITLAACCLISMWVGYGIGFITGFYKGVDEGKKARGES
jgi:ABC-type dipeptide/oligopeptide/nickel transport system permease subunit